MAFLTFPYFCHVLLLVFLLVVLARVRMVVPHLRVLRILLQPPILYRCDSAGARQCRALTHASVPSCSGLPLVAMDQPVTLSWPDLKVSPNTPWTPLPHTLTVPPMHGNV